MDDYITSTVLSVNQQGNFAFLNNPEGWEDIYLSLEDLEGEKAPTKANILKFRIEHNDKGLRAKDATIID